VRSPALAIVVVCGTAGCGGDNAQPEPTPPKPHVPPFHARSVHAVVRPAVGGRHTRFRILIPRPQFIGRRAHAFWGYELRARQRPFRAGCITDTDGSVNVGRPGDPARIVLNPATQKGAIWCRGRFFGRLYYQENYACPAGTCHVPRGFPHHSRLVARVGFRVVSAPR
jgi:hypothetical protein